DSRRHRRLGFGVTRGTALALIPARVLAKQVGAATARPYGHYGRKTGGITACPTARRSIVGLPNAMLYETKRVPPPFGATRLLRDFLVKRGAGVSVSRSRRPGRSAA